MLTIEPRLNHEENTQQNIGENDYLANNPELSASNHAYTTQAPDSVVSPHSKSGRALVRFYLKQYRSHMDIMRPYLLREDEQAQSIVELHALAIVRIQNRLDVLGWC